jgi:hypothetical protein
MTLELALAVVLFVVGIIYTYLCLGPPHNTMDAVKLARCQRAAATSLIASLALFIRALGFG